MPDPDREITPKELSIPLFILLPRSSEPTTVPESRNTLHSIFGHSLRSDSGRISRTLGLSQEVKSGDPNSEHWLSRKNKIKTPNSTGFFPSSLSLRLNGCASPTGTGLREGKAEPMLSNADTCHGQSQFRASRGSGFHSSLPHYLTKG
jgi:hypothetical protein